MAQESKRPLSDKALDGIAETFQEGRDEPYSDGDRSKLRAAIDRGAGAVQDSDYPKYVRDGRVGQHPMPEQLAVALEGAIAESAPAQYKQLDEGQKIYLRSWLFSVASYAAELTEENRRLHGGGLPVRKLPKASSFVFSGEAEQAFYKRVLDGKLSADEARQQFNPQDIVFTTHPNFSATRDLAQLTPGIIKSFLGMSFDTLTEIARGGDTAKAALKQQFAENGIGEQFARALTHLTPRKHRNRADELDEATIDLIPRIYEGAAEEAAIMLRRAQTVGVKVPGTLNFEQARTLGNMTAEHSTWFTDGDGKRTSHSWDNHYAVTSIKAATMKQYIKDLQKIKQQVTHKPIVHELDEVLSKMNERLALVERFRDASRQYMLDLTELQTAGENMGATTREEVQLSNLRGKTAASGTEYSRLRGDGRTVEALRFDNAPEVLKLAEKLKQLELRQEVNFPKLKSAFDEKTALSQVDGLIIRAAKGDFPVKIERRENANQHKQAMRYFMDALAAGGVKRMLIGMPIPGSDTLLSEQDFSGGMRGTGSGDETRLRHVLEVLDGMVTRERRGEPMNDTEKKAVARMHEIIRDTFNNTEDKVMPKYEQAADAMPRELGPEASVFLDDVAPFFISGDPFDKAYSKAFKRVIIAEAGSPPNEMLAHNVESQIRAEAVLRDKNDMLTANIFKNLLRSDVAVVPLYEDPDAIVHTPTMLKEKLANKTYHDALGIDMEQAEDKSLRKTDGKRMTAYEFLKMQGFSDQVMSSGRMIDGVRTPKMDIDALKKAYVYVGPHKMLANSDSAKRGTLAASTLNNISVLECYEAAAHNLLEGKNGEKYLYVNQTYLGQGGALARTTGTDALVNTLTEQGQHPTLTTGVYSAMKSVLRAVTRLVSRSASEDVRARGGLLLDDSARWRVATETMGLGNPYGLQANVGDMERMKQACRKAIRRRIESTRDDVPVDSSSPDSPTRYEAMLAKYGEDFIENYSARPAGKGGKVDFVGIRAIGLAGKEFGFFSNIVGVSEMFDMDQQGRMTNLDLMARLYLGDPTVKHNMDAAAYTACLSSKTLPYVWKKGGVEMDRGANGETVLRKDGQEAPLAKLVEKYKDGEIHYKNFDAADLALANIHHQTENLVSGLAQIRAAIELRHGKDGQKKEGGDAAYVAPPNVKVNDPIELIPEHLHSTVRHAQELAEQLVAYYRKMEAKTGVVKDMKDNAKKQDRMSPEARSLRMAKDAYYQLMETSLEQQALARVPYMGAGKA